MVNIEKILFVTLLFPFLVLFSACVNSAFVYFGWNGCHVLFGVREISFKEAFWLAMLARAIFTTQTSVTKE